MKTTSGFLFWHLHPRMNLPTGRWVRGLPEIMEIDYHTTHDFNHGN
ncbi:MAG: hypothetical protein ABR980_08350 [Ignavibacteriaceae bacterium]